MVNRDDPRFVELRNQFEQTVENAIDWYITQGLDEQSAFERVTDEFTGINQLPEFDADGYLPEVGWSGSGG